MSYTAKKWLARLAFVGLMAGGLVVFDRAIGNPGSWAEDVATIMVAIGAVGIYEIFLRPTKPLTPATGLEAAEHFPNLVTDAWQFAVPATRETIRAALLSVHDEQLGRLELALAKDHAVRAARYDKGWELFRYRPEVPTADAGVRTGGINATEPLKLNWWAFVRGRASGHSFSNIEAEQALIAFLEGFTPDHVVWRETTRG